MEESGKVQDKPGMSIFVKFSQDGNGVDVV